MPGRKRTGGFGIVEVVIVLAIICVILGALIWIGRAAAANNVRSQQRAQATYLAQEGIEVVRQIRDSNWIDGSSATSWENMELDVANSKLIQPSEFFSPKKDCLRFKTDFSLGRFALKFLSAHDDCSTLPASDFSTADSMTINKTVFRRSIYLENYSLSSNGTTNDVPVKGINNDASAPYNDGTIYYLKVRSVVIWGPSFSITSANKIEVSEILTNWRPNY